MKRTILSAAILLAGGSIWAQNLNPTVEVTNVYAREAGGIEKPGQLLQAPDSVFKFNLDFDYSVNSTPYKGAYEFHPYLVELRPMDRPSQENTFFLRAGAGYSLHPEFTVIWTPLAKENFHLNVYADHKSYIGKYRNIALDNNNLWSHDGTTRQGMDLRSAVGANALFNWTAGSLVADLKYENVTASDFFSNNFSNNRFVAKARVKSAPGRNFAYEAGTYLSFLGVTSGFRETHTLTDAMAGMHLGGNYLKLGLSLETVSQPDGAAGIIGIYPHYILTLGKFNMDLGAKLSFGFKSGSGFCPQRPGIIVPDVNISFVVIPDAMQLRLFATGGNQLATYDKFLARNPFIAAYGARTDVRIDRVNTGAGIRGNVSGKFHYDVKVGYSWSQNVWTWGYDLGNNPVVGYIGSLQTIYADAQLGWQSDRLDIGAHLYYGRTFPKLETELDRRLFSASPFQAKGHAYYNWGGRIKAGVDVEARTRRKSALSSIPGYVDLGLGAELQMSRNLGFWLRLGNLLNQTIQRIPFYSENGIYFTVGVTWNL